jgi:hypothetical protein
MAQDGEADDRFSKHDKGEAHMLRRAAVITAGLAMAASFGLAGAGVASAAAPALKIKPNAIWTFEIKGNSCDQEKFDTATHTFFSPHHGDAGTWQFGDGSAILMIWTSPQSLSGHNFGGRFVSTTTPVEYKGSFNGDPIALRAKLVKGAVATFNGVTC